MAKSSGDQNSQWLTEGEAWNSKCPENRLAPEHREIAGVGAAVRVQVISTDERMRVFVTALLAGCENCRQMHFIECLQSLADSELGRGLAAFQSTRWFITHSVCDNEDSSSPVTKVQLCG